MIASTTLGRITKNVDSGLKKHLWRRQLHLERDLWRLDRSAHPGAWIAFQACIPPQLVHVLTRSKFGAPAVAEC